MAAVRPSPAPPGRGSISEECPGYFPGVLTARGAEESRAGWPALQLESQPCLTCSTRQALGPLSPGVWPGSRSQEGGVRPGWSQAAEGSESWGGWERTGLGGACRDPACVTGGPQAMSGCPQRQADFLSKVGYPRQLTGRHPRLWRPLRVLGSSAQLSRRCWGLVGSVWLRNAHFQRFGLLCALLIFEG